MEHGELNHLLREGIAAARAGQTERARDLFLYVIAMDEEMETAWLWLSEVASDPEERQICLENVLTLNPNNAAARNGLRWLREQGSVSPPKHVLVSPLPPNQAPRAELRQVTDEPCQHGSPASGTPAPIPIKIDPYGCPYCGGSVSGGEPRCDHCGQLVTVRLRKKDAGVWLGWLALSFFLLGATGWMEGYLISQLVQTDQLPQWLDQTVVRFVLGSAMFDSEGIQGDVAKAAGFVVSLNYGLAGLCTVAAVGLALRSRIAYFGSFLLGGLVVVATGAGLLTQLSGWLPAILRLGFVAIVLKWLADSAAAFEWDTRSYDADVDRNLKTDLDYHNRAQRYYGQGMWAKAAAHWQVAIRLAPGQVQYHAELAKAYIKMGYPRAALAEADKALAGAPGDEELSAFRDSLAELEESR